MAGTRPRRARVVLDLPAPRQPQPGRHRRGGHARPSCSRPTTAGVPARVGRAVRGVHARARRLPVQLRPRPRRRHARRDRLPQRPGARPGRAPMVDDDEWAWVADAVPSSTSITSSSRTSLPVFVPGGMHGLQQWNEAVCDGAWGPPVRLARASGSAAPSTSRTGRRSTVVPSAVNDLVVDVGDRSRTAPGDHQVLSGDIHFSYIAKVELPEIGGRSAPLDGQEPGTTVHQAVSSPVRNALRPRDRTVLRFGVSRVGRWIGGRLQRWSVAARAGSPGISSTARCSTTAWVSSPSTAGRTIWCSNAPPTTSGEPVLEVAAERELAVNAG